MTLTCLVFTAAGACSEWSFAGGDPRAVLSLGFGAGMVAGAVGFGVGVIVRLISSIRV